MHRLNPFSQMIQFSKTIFARSLLVTAATGIIVAISLTMASGRFVTQIAHDGVANLSRISTKAAADSMASALNFGSIGRVISELDDLYRVADGFVALAYVVDAQGNLIANEAAGVVAPDGTLSALIEETFRSGTAQVSADGMSHASPISLGAAAPIGALVTVWTADSIMPTIRADKVKTIALSFLILAVLLLMGSYFLHRTLNLPMKKLQSSVQKVSEGNYEAEITVTNPHNEVGALALHLQDMRQSLIEGRERRRLAQEKQEQEQRVIQTLRQSLKILANGDLTVRISQDLPPDYAELGQDFNNAASAFHDAIGKVVALAERIRTESEEIGRHSDDLSQRTENQAATLEETAAALDELTNGVRGAADGAREVEGIVSTARTEATKSGEIVQKTIDAMSEIEQSSSQISAIIAVIDDIAFQTNLLALNAGVEAARAGDAGRGFAVVAAEVRALAQRSSEAAQEIKTLIVGSSAHVSNGVKLVADAGTALTAITDRVVQIATLMSDMANNAQEQSTNLNEINIGVGNLDQVTQRNAGMVEAANAASMALLGQSQALSHLVENFRIGQRSDSPLLLDKRVA